MTSVPLILPVLLIGVLHWLMPSLVPPTLPFGVRVPLDHANAPVIAAQRRRYRIGTAAVALVAVMGAAAATGHPSAVPAAIGAELVAGVILYLTARRRITAAKVTEDWFGGRRQVAVTDTSLRTDPERYPWRWAVPSVLLPAVTAVIGIVRYPRMPHRLPTYFGLSGHPDHYATRSVGSVFGPVLTQALLTALLLVLAWAVLRGRAQLDAEDPRAGIRHRRFVSTSARMLSAVAAGVNVVFLLAALAMWNVIGSGPVVSTVTTVLGLLAVGVPVGLAVRAGQGGSRLKVDAADGGGRAGDAGTGAATDHRPKPVNRDDDRLYRWGLVYYNPDDPALFVPKRFGVGWTVNMARPLAWVLLAATIAVAAIAPAIGLGR